MEKVYTEKAPAAIGPYSQAMKAGGLLFTSGQIPIDPATGAVAGEDITAQTEQVMQNLGAVLEAAGTSFQRTVKTLCFLQTMDDFAAFNEVYARYFTEKPARSCVAVRARSRRASSSRSRRSRSCKTRFREGKDHVLQIMRM